MYYNEVNIIVIVFASLSMALCLSQIVTCIVFRRKLLSKTYIQVVFFMGISDFLGAMSMVASFKDGSILCSIQGPLIIFSQCSAILWADCAVRILYLAVIHDRQPHESNGMRFYHLCCWGIPLLICTLLVSTTNIGRSADDDGHFMYCWATSEEHSSNGTIIAWHTVFFTVVWVSILYISFHFYIILHHVKFSYAESSPVIREAIAKLAAYPVIFVSCYSLISCRFVISLAGASFRDVDYYVLDVFCDSLQVSQGLFTCIFFYTVNPNVLNLWRIHLYRSDSLASIGSAPISLDVSYSTDADISNPTSSPLRKPILSESDTVN